MTVLATIHRSVRKARRRLFWQAFVTRWPVTLSAGLSLGAGYIVAEPFLGESLLNGYRWYVVGGFAALGTATAIWWAKRATPSETVAALEVDSRFELRERLTTAVGLTDAERATPAGAAVLADAAEKVTPISVRERFPIRPTWSSAAIPAVAAALGLAVFFPLSPNGELFASSETEGKKASDAIVSAAVPKNPTPFTQRNKPPELVRREDKSKELKELEEQINELIKKYDTDPNRETPEKLKEKITEMTSLEEKVKKFNDMKRDKLEKLEQQLQQLDRLNKDQEFQEGPAKKLNEALQKGDLEKAKQEFDELKKKVKNGELNAEEKQELAKQMEKMRDQLQRNEKAKEREEKLKQMLDKAKKEGREQDAESLERELKQAQKQCQECEQAGKQLGDKLQKAKDALEKGDMEEAAKQLEEAGKSLEETEGELKDLEEAKDYLQRLKDDKKQACKKCQGDGEGEPKEKDDAEWTPNGQIGAGRRKEDKDAKTSSQDERIKGLFDPKGKKTYGGSTKGPAFKTASTGELGPAIQSAAQEAPAAADSQRLPRDAKETVKEYFENLSGQKQ
ncbi:MAG: hypothetical protein ACRC8S_23270 [Fimbriiglobus sp.]